MRKLKLFVLWCGEKEKNMALAKFFADQLLTVATAKSGKIRVGSNITQIARYLDVLRPNEKCAQTISFHTNDRLNLDSLAHHFMIHKFMVNRNVYLREIDKQGNTIWLNSDALDFRTLAEGEALITS